MNEPATTQAKADAEIPGNLSGNPHEDELERTGTVSARHGRINGWLWIVYIIMLVWAVYYAIEYWSLPGYNELGPGLGDY